MKNISWTVALLLLISASVQANADYKCTIKRISTAEDAPNPTLKLYEKEGYIGKQFTVEKETGNMVGALKNSYATRPQVIDSGSHENSFKVVTTMRLYEGAGRGTNIYALTISEYVKSTKKPFVFLENDVVFFGTCEHF